MVAFNFQKQFAPKILDGTKLQTFRATKRCDVGDQLQLYMGQRTKACQKLKDTICTFVLPGIIDRRGIVIGEDAHRQLSKEENERADLAYAFGFPREIEGLPIDEFAILDGFDCHNQMLQFFENQGRKFPFYGWLHRWAP